MVWRLHFAVAYVAIPIQSIHSSLQYCTPTPIHSSLQYLVGGREQGGTANSVVDASSSIAGVLAHMPRFRDISGVQRSRSSDAGEDLAHGNVRLY